MAVDYLSSQPNWADIRHPPNRGAEPYPLYERNDLSRIPQYKVGNWNLHQVEACPNCFPLKHAPAASFANV